MVNENIYMCKICKNENENKIYIAREMMFGSLAQFKYVECSSCGCLQIADIPEDLSRYYPPRYYSFAKKNIYVRRTIVRKIKNILKQQRLAYSLGNKNLVGQVVNKIFGPTILPSWLKGTCSDPKAKILDVGCGAGDILLRLASEGFFNLTGIDPYISEDLEYSVGVRIYKKEISQMSGIFDLIMMHHSFEHMKDPATILKAAAGLMHPDSTLLIRIPVVPSKAWERCQTNWVQLDAPRHLYLHSVQSLKLLAAKSGFKVIDIIYDSTDFQFWGSEQYVRGISLFAQESYEVNPQGGQFSENEIAQFKDWADECNRTATGDQACFYLKKL